MSCNVTRVGLRPLHQATSTLQRAITTQTRFLLPALSTSQARVATVSLLPKAVHRVTPRLYSTFQDVATKDTRISGSRSAALTSAKLGWRRPCQDGIQCPSHFEAAFGERLSRSAAQRRRFSDKRVAKEARLGESQNKASTTTGLAETSKAAHENAATGAGNKTILDRLPHLHRPTKEELLAAATGFWQRIGIRFKWFSIRSFRPYTLDEIGAFISWVFLGHVLWIVIGTTTFVSLAIWAVNTVFAQETLAGWVGNYLTKSSGIKIVFESAIVPTWKNGVITFNNVFVSRRPGQQTKKERTVKKGSSTTAAAAAAAEAAMAENKRLTGDSDDDGNYSQFDVTIDTVNVTLSFSKWFNGKGLLRDVEIRGVRGVIDRTFVKPTEEYVDPKSYRHQHTTGDFEIDHFQMADVLLTVHQPSKFRPFTVSVYTCDLPRLRKQWLFYDFMSANSMSGSFDDSLFTVHPRQVHGHTGAPLTSTGQEDSAPGQWKKHSRLRIDGLKIDHLNRGVEGPFSWIHEGNVDIVADVMLPNDDDGFWRHSWKKSTEAMHDFYDRMEATVASAQANGKQVAPQNMLQNATDAFERSQDQYAITEADKRFVVLDMKVHLNDVRASVPLFTRDISYVNNALVRPIVAYINSRHAFIPINCRVVKRQSEYDGSWTVFDSGLLEDLSREVYAAFARDIEDGQARNRRMRKVGWWTVQLAAQALFIGLAGQLA